MPLGGKSKSLDSVSQNEMFKAIAAEAPQGIIVLHGDQILYVNPKLADLIGYPLEEIQKWKAADFLKFVFEPDRVDTNQRIKTAIKGEVKTKLYQLRIKNKKGEIRWLQVLPRAIQIQEDTAILAMITDISEQKKTELAYRDLVENSLQGLIVLQDGKVVYSNQAFADMSGYTIEELLALTPKQVEESVHPDYRERVWGRFRDRLAGKPVPSHYSFKAIRKDREERWLEMYASLIEFNDKPAVQTTFIDITDRQESDIKLQESEARYRTLFNDVPIGLYRTTQDGKILNANPALVQLLGAPDRETLLEANAADFYINPDERDQWHDIKDYTGIIQGHEAQFQRMDNKIIWVRDSFRAVRDENGQIQFYDGTLEDITEQKEAEQALKERERRYRALFENTNDAVFLVSTDLNQIQANQRAADMLGYTVEELQDLGVADVVAEREYPDSERVQKALLAGEQVPVYERILRKKNGEEFPVEINVALVTDNEGNPLHFQSIMRDITERKRAEQALKESEEKYRTLVETSPDAITLTDLEGRVIMANKQALQLYGAESEQDLIGVSAFELIAKEDVPRAMENMQKTLAEGVSGTLEYTLLRRDGSPYPAELNAAVIRDADGNPQAFIGVLRDISDRKEAEARYRSLFDSVPIGLFRTTPADGTILDVNPALIEMLGFEKKEPLLKRTASSFYIDPAARKQWETMVARQDVVTGVQAQFRREDSEIIWVELSARAIRNQKGEVEYYEGTLEDITDRKRSEEALKESEAKYRALIDQSLQGIVIFQDNRVVFSNPQMLDVMGLTLEEMLEMPPDAVWELVHPEYREKIQQRMQDRFAGKDVPDRYELPVQRTDGKPLWVEIWVKQIEYQGKPAIQATIMDITERKRAEQALQESEVKYRNLVEQSLQGIVLSQGMPPRIYFANEAFAEIVGYSFQEILAMSQKKVVELIHPADQKLVLERVEKCLTGKSAPQHYEYRMIRKDGSIRWVEVFATKIEYEGEPAIQAAYADITERKEAEAALQESEEKFRALVEELSDWVWEMDLEGKITYSNNAVEDILGFSSGQVVGRTPCDFLRPEDVERAKQTFNELKQDQRPIRTLVIKFVHRDGSDVILEARGQPVENEHGELLGFRGICRDITDRLKMIEQLRVLEERM